MKKWNDNFFKQNLERIMAYQKMREDWDKKYPPVSCNFLANPDGSFRAANIPPGDRTLTISLIDPATRVYIATINQNFTVPEKPSPAPLDLGTLEKSSP
jgi:hypothetical protein